MNQPQIDKLTESDAPQDNASLSSNVVPKGNTVKPIEKKSKEPSKVMAQTPNTLPSHNGVAIQTTSIDQNSTTKAFEIFAGETYGAVLVRWLDREGYSPLIKSLDKNANRALEQKVDKDSVKYSQFDKASKALLENATMNARNQDWLSEVAKSELGYQLILDHESKTATIIGKPPSIRITGSNPDQVKKFHSAYESETYEQVIFRWLAAEGYEKVGKLINGDETKVLSQLVTSSQDFYGQFEAVATQLMDLALAQAIANKKNEREGWISDESKKNLNLYLRLNEIKKEAILTTTKQPTYMFSVAEGSLRDNFLRLTNAYGWKATKEHYLAKDYKVSFPYPIVTEEGNVKQAIETLLTDFPRLRGAVVPSTRTTYVLTEE
ncbi:hypothetical protein EYW48_07100 [Vibrio sp. 1180_3]|nr:hypothetical protein [Vibrio sp. 1180_3]